MKVCCAGIWLLSLSALAESPAPSVVINNYANAPAPAPAAVTAVPPPPSVLPPAIVPSENEPEGLSVGVSLGYLSTESSGAFGTVGLTPQLRFLRFLSLEGEVALAVASLDSRSRSQSKPFHVSGQLIAQLTFKSALLDVTPRIGVGMEKWGSESSLRSGPYSVLGAEVKIVSLRLAVDVRQKIGGNEIDPYDPYYRSVDPYYNYPYDFIPAPSSRGVAAPQLNLGASWDLSERSRVGAQCQVLGVSGRFQLFYRFGL